MKNWPLKWRLSLLICCVLLSTIVTVSIVAYVELEEALLRNIDPTLKAMAEGIVADLAEPLSPEARQGQFRAITDWKDGPYCNQYRVWMDGRNEDSYASPLPTGTHDDLFVNLSAVNKPEVGEFTFFNLIRQKYRYRAVWTRHFVTEGIANVMVANSSHYAYHEMEEFLQMLLLLGGSLLLGSLLLVPVIVGWGMRPIDRVAGILRNITHKNVGQESLKTPGVPRELLPFVEALNGMLVRLDRAIRQQDQFTADAAHELRTPLAVLKSTIQTARMKERNVADYVKALDDAEQDVERMERLIEQLLALARVDGDSDWQNTTRISLDSLLVNLVEVFDARAAQQGGRVICENCPDTWVTGSESQLSQLFTNVLDNAIKYGPPKGTVKVTLDHAADGYATVCIHDDGGNIPSEAITHLFDRFYRVDSSRSRATGGSGLGFAIAREIADRHNGRIDITSQPGSGTSVVVQLPRL